MDAHDPEYLAAAAGMADTYGQPPAAEQTAAVGDLVWFKLADWNYPKSARVIDHTPLGALIVEADTAHRYMVWPSDLVRIGT
jgi:hypothetical protein